MNQPTVASRVGGQPAVHFLCSGIFLDSALQVGNALAFPIAPLGMASEATYAAQYQWEVTSQGVEAARLTQIVDQVNQAQACVAIVIFPDCTEKNLGGA